MEDYPVSRAVQAVFAQKWKNPYTLDLEEIYGELHIINTLDQNSRQFPPDDLVEVSEDEADSGKSLLKPPPHPISVEAHIKADLDLAQQQENLQFRAQQLSRGKIRQLSLLDLPLDVLHIVKRFFQLESPQWEHTSGRWRKGRGLHMEEFVPDVRNLRLVNRLFNDVFSPLLFGVLPLYVDHKSLRRLEMVEDNPRLAKGVRHIVLGLEHRPSEVARSLSEFTSVWIGRLKSFANGSYNHTRWVQAVNDLAPSFRKYPDSAFQEVDEAVDTIVAAWKARLHVSSDQPLLTDEEMQYQDILERSYREVCRNYEEERRPITDRQFVEGFSRAARKMTHLKSLIFQDWQSVDQRLSQIAVALLDQNALYELLTNSGTFQTLDSIWKGQSRITTDLDLNPRFLNGNDAAASLLLDLPISINGIHLNYLRVEKFPPNLKSLRSEFQNPSISQKLELANGHANVRNIYINTNDMKYQELSAGEQAILDDYLIGMLSGPSLLSISLSLRGAGKFQHPHNFGRVISKIDWSRMRKIVLCHISVTESELEQLCTSLGPAVERFWLYDILLTQGRWSHVLDVMRDGFSELNLQNNRLIGLSRLFGGEFNHNVKANGGYWDDRSWGPVQDRFTLRAVRYVRREETENPWKNM